MDLTLTGDRIIKLEAQQEELRYMLKAAQNRIDRLERYTNIECPVCKQGLSLYDFDWHNMNRH